MRVLVAVVLTLTLSLSVMAQSSQDDAQRLLRSLAELANSKPAPAVDPGWPVRVYSVRYIDVHYLENLLASFGPNLKAVPNLRAISVRGPVATLDAIGEIVKQYDVPANASKNVDTTVYLLLASTQANFGPEAEAIPAILRPVIDQLRVVMTYKSYRVLDTILTRGTEGDVLRTQGVISKLAESDPADSQPSYSFQARPRVTGEGPAQVIHFDDLNFNVTLHLPEKGNQNFTIGTAIDVKKGQQVVVGKTTILDRALILVMSAKVVE